MSKYFTGLHPNNIALVCISVLIFHSCGKKPSKAAEETSPATEVTESNSEVTQTSVAVTNDGSTASSEDSGGGVILPITTPTPNPTPTPQTPYNVGMGKTYSSSSVGAWLCGPSTLANRLPTEDKAFDGNTSGNYYADCSIYHNSGSESGRRWLKVDLGSVKNITTVKLYFRTAYDNGTIKVSASETELTCNDDLTCGEGGSVAYIEDSSNNESAQEVTFNSPARYLMLSIPQSRPYLEIAEMEVMGTD